MGKIHKLPDDLANQIAAGEVVERPASVIKELVENSIDASSRRIAITVEFGGKKLIRVEDDGEGMEPDDARLAIERLGASAALPFLNADHDGLGATPLHLAGDSVEACARVEAVIRAMGSDAEMA